MVAAQAVRGPFRPTDRSRRIRLGRESSEGYETVGLIVRRPGNLIRCILEYSAGSMREKVFSYAKCNPFSDGFTVPRKPMPTIGRRSEPDPEHSGSRYAPSPSFVIQLLP